MSKWALWGILVSINKLIQILYDAITLPLQRYSYRMTIRLPFSHFYFRPLFLCEVYMALGIWEPYVRGCLSLSQGDLFIDVGAHIGYYTIYACGRVGESGSVIAIEPDKRNLRVLYKNVEAVKASNVRVVEAAAGFNGSLYLQSRPNPLYNSTTKSKDYHGQEEVKSVSLDTLSEDVTLPEYGKVYVKIDVEGGERDVIRGGSSFLKRYRPTLIVEAGSLPNLQEALGGLGYSCHRIFRCYYLCSPLEKP